VTWPCLGTLDTALEGVDAVFLVWVLPLAAAAMTLQRIASHAERIVLLTSAHRTAHPFFQQPNALRSVHAGIERLVETTGLQWTLSASGRIRDQLPELVGTADQGWRCRALVSCRCGDGAYSRARHRCCRRSRAL
jgi:hypothetical protein